MRPRLLCRRSVDGKTVYEMEAPEFAEEMMALIDAGADILGGCCGTTPEHIRLLTQKIQQSGRMDEVSHLSRQGKVIRRALSNERVTRPIDLDGPFMVIGERINPTGPKRSALTRAILQISSCAAQYRACRL